MFLAQPKINLQSFKTTPDGLKQRLKAFERKWSLGAPVTSHIIIHLINTSVTVVLYCSLVNVRQKSSVSYFRVDSHLSF